MVLTAAFLCSGTAAANQLSQAPVEPLSDGSTGKPVLKNEDKFYSLDTARGLLALDYQKIPVYGAEAIDLGELM